VIVAVMRKARLTKKRSADDLGVDELTDDLGVEIDTRPASQRGSSRQSWPPSDEEDEGVPPCSREFAAWGGGIYCEDL
jgi:hypothetical protein